LKDCTLNKGQGQGEFKKKKIADKFKAAFCFSLLAKSRSLDVAVEKQEDYVKFINALSTHVSKVQP